MKPNTAFNKGNIENVNVQVIAENPENPRSRIIDIEDLKASIKAVGLIQPITVRRLTEGEENSGEYMCEVVAGSRRFAACKALGYTTIPCVVLDNVDKRKAFELATTENIIRENMTAVDEAKAVARMFEDGKTRAEIAAFFGKSAKWAEGRRRIVGLGEDALKMLETGKINLGHAEALTMCDDSRVEKFLSMATWKSPEDLKAAIMNDRKRLEKAPFNWKKVCAKCPNRSDCQRDLFGDVTDVFCLDSECFEKQISYECDRLRKDFLAAGYTEVSDADYNAAKNCWYDWIDATTEDEDEKAEIEKIKGKGGKAQFWIDEETAEHGLSFKVIEDEKVEINKSTTNNNEFIRKTANELESKDAMETIEDIVNGLDDKAIALMICVMDDSDIDYSYTEVNADGTESKLEESVLDHVGENVSVEDDEENQDVPQKVYLARQILDKISFWNGIENKYRKGLGIESREFYEGKAREQIENDSVN